MQQNLLEHECACYTDANVPGMVKKVSVLLLHSMSLAFLLKAQHLLHLSAQKFDLREQRVCLCGTAGTAASLQLGHHGTQLRQLSSCVSILNC